MINQDAVPVLQRPPYIAWPHSGSDFAGTLGIDPTCGICGPISPPSDERMDAPYRPPGRFRVVLQRFAGQDATFEC
ncbi:hypothetical protein GCM10010185_26320 [Saccharothrix coeruleofusca]|uniref:Uncharacterized protein n=1 Tax=Saccharothrix coeruleofusca TaxID=33919 RepID=A0A918ED02_9PSEU|nr:hypothetical protein GCM10010185_26320 [Saccharothrix coeruleofusca]